MKTDYMETVRSTRKNSLRVAAALALAGVLAAGASVARAQEKSAQVSKIERLNRAPVSKDVLRVKLPTPTIARLPNGLTILLLEDHKLPTIAFTMWIRPGQLADPNDLPGLASFTADMLREGTERRSSAQIAAEVDSLGASLTADSRFGASYTSVNGSGLIDSAPQILDLMSDIVLHPAFPEAELAKYKQRQAAGLEERLSNPTFLGQQAFRRVVYGDAPLSVAAPTKESIEKATRDDLRKFHAQHYHAGNAILGVTGDFQTSEMRALIEKYFGAWTGKAEAPLAFPAVVRQQPAKITLVDRPGSVQTYIIGGGQSIRRTDPIYPTLAVMNQVVGGGAQARLFLDLREEHGYTYGAYSNFDAEIYPGRWFGFSPVRTPVTDGSMTQFVYEFKRINNEPVPQSELDDARRAIVANFALSLEQPAQLLGNYLTSAHFGLPSDYWEKYPDRVAAVDAAAVQAAAKRFVDLDHMQWVCVGDRKAIQETLAKYGPVSVIDVKGNEEK